MDWTPTISELAGRATSASSRPWRPISPRAGWCAGQQLPTQRALAKALGIDLTTVTRAYTEARRRGIMEARVGQGSFVSETSARRAVDLPHPVAIDLSMNVPPHPLEAQLDERIIAGMEAIRAQSGLTALPQLSAARRQRARARGRGAMDACARSTCRMPKVRDLSRRADDPVQSARCILRGPVTSC